MLRDQLRRCMVTNRERPAHFKIFIYARGNTCTMETEIRARYEDGVFKPLQKVRGLKDGQIVEIAVQQDDLAALAMQGGSFDFLADEEDLYTEADIVAE